MRKKVKKTPQRRAARRPNRRPRKPSLPRPAGPYWLPAGSFWDGLPDGTKQAVTEVLGPAYQHLVVEAAGELERSAGITLVHLMWLEICDQLHLSECVADRSSFASMLANPAELIAQHMHLLTAKNNTAELLVKLRLLREMLARDTVAGPAASPRLPLAHPVLPEPAPAAEPLPWIPMPPASVCAPNATETGKS